MKTQRLCCVLCWLAGCSLLLALLGARSVEGQEKLPDGLQVVSVESSPTSVDLTHRFDYRQVIVLGRLASGESVDLTRLVELAAPSKFVTASPSGLVRPVADGADQLTAAETRKAKADERKVDRRVYDELGITPDRQREKEEPGIKMLIPNFYRAR